MSSPGSSTTSSRERAEGSLHSDSLSCCQEGQGNSFDSRDTRLPPRDPEDGTPLGDRDITHRTNHIVTQGNTCTSCTGTIKHGNNETDTVNRNSSPSHGGASGHSDILRHSPYSVCPQKRALVGETRLGSNPDIKKPCFENDIFQAVSSIPENRDGDCGSNTSVMVSLLCAGHTLHASQACLDLREPMDLDSDSGDSSRTCTAPKIAQCVRNNHDNITDMDTENSFDLSVGIQHSIGADHQLDNQSQSSMYIHKLPFGLLLHVFRFLPLFDLLRRAALVCKKWHGMSKDPSMWQAVKLRGQIKVNDVILERMTSLSNCVVQLDITDSKLITDEGLTAVLNRCRKMKVLKLTRCHHFRGVGLKAIGMFCPLLQELYLDNCYGLSADVLQVISYGCQQLRVVSMGQCCNVTDKGVEALAEGCRHLRVVILNHCPWVTDHGLRELVDKCPAIEQLSLMACNLTDQGVCQFSQLPKLRKLDISNISSVSKTTVMTIMQQCPLVEVLDLSLILGIDDECIEVIAAYGSSLERLYLVSCNVTDKALSALGKHCKQLTSVDFSWCKGITDNGVRSLAECCPLLTYFGLICCDSVTGKTIDELVRNYPKVKFSAFKQELLSLLERARSQGLISDRNA